MISYAVFINYSHPKICLQKTLCCNMIESCIIKRNFSSFCVYIIEKDIFMIHFDNLFDIRIKHYFHRFDHLVD